MSRYITKKYFISNWFLLQKLYSFSLKIFSALNRDKAAYASPPKNFIANPSKKGSGYG